MNTSRCQWRRGMAPAAATALACLWVVGAATAPVMGGAPGSSTAQTPISPAAELPAVTAGFAPSNQRSNLQPLISSANVAPMKLAWTIPANAPVSSTPLVANGQVYIADWSGTVTAADAVTGKVVWQKQIEQPNTQWPYYGFDGTDALYNGVLIEASVEGTACGVDPVSGAAKWQAKFTDQPS